MNIWRKLSIATAGAAMVCCTTSGVAQAANLVTNGSFEVPVVTINGGSYSRISSNTNPPITGWQVASGGNVDLIRGYWASPNGSQSVELNGGLPGTISQNIATQSATDYKLSFSLAGNPDSAGLKSAEVKFGNFTTNVSFNTTGKTKATVAGMGWQDVSFFIPRTSLPGLTSNTLSFKSLSSGGFGVAIDNVVVERAPFGFSPGLGIVGLGAVAATAQIKRRLKSLRLLKVSSL